MIESIEGEVLRLSGDLVSLLVGPLCLQIHFFGQQPLLQKEHVLLYTHLAWKEDGPQLYGFTSHKELQLFQELLKISGIGPKTAGSLIKTLGTFGLTEAIRLQDYNALAQVRGLSKKSAQRILLEWQPTPLDHPISSCPWTHEAEQALVGLGLIKKKAKQLVQQTWAQHQNVLSLEEFLGLVLRQLPTRGIRYTLSPEE
ncbi:Holliday junction branch migration protein RuvA [Candidatus Similichlamydia laticola]|uniref:Holliday junction branch migration complex subunit RuvA n=1 Tax=Candidatus Similichlamydia laticola TaxID=2170265 RepID=A0A369KG01_9BACT|nr:Holliday junction branch migration protein RuvA [Candidatus Similichlamydia laticola]RDB31837.1 Holliday junction DNA helicase RuvA [Candidatus Similichlamydia laticola]